MNLPKPYYQDNAVTIYHADCRDILPLLETGSIDLVLTDPPYSVPVKYEVANDLQPRSWGDLLVMEPFFKEVLGLIKRCIRHSGQVYIHCDGDSYPIFYKVGYSLWPQSQVLVWYKPTGRRGRGWLHSHELILHLRSPDTTYAEGFRQDVIGIMPIRTLNRQHPAEKPGALLDFIIKAVPGNPVILDPFMGSGTMLRVAKDCGYRATGIEIEERYCEIAAKRMSQAVLL